jgi:choline dehydrogenase-like flavoprotein
MATTYDTIIVGAGSAGCVLAHRLGEDASRRIMVIEAGGKDDNPLIHIPLGVGKIWSNPKYNWSYYGEPEPNVDNRSIFHPRGKVLGGSSSINIMAYVRCHRNDFDRLPQLGLRGWSYADCLPYFKRAESYTGQGDEKYRGRLGPLKTRQNPAHDAIYDAFLTAAPELGYKPNPDYNGAEQEGFSKMQHTIGNGRRWSTATGYLRPALKRGNVDLVIRAQATAILFEGPRAVGIRYRKDNALVEARAESVILSGGAYNSPQLLMLSGIGPADELRDLGIEVRVDLKGVGKNLWDHPSLSTLWARKNKAPFLDKLRLDRLALAMVQAQVLHSGFATLLPANGTAFIRSTPDVEVPDIQAYCGSGGYQSREWFPGWRKRGDDVISLLFCHVREQSRGAVTLRSTDPMDKVKIFNNFLSTEYDRRAMREGVKFCMGIAHSKAFADYAGSSLIPPEEELKTDAGIDAFVRRAMITIYHPAGTCKAGTDPEAVVDPEFRVRGTEGLRVIDASVWPEPLGGNINAPTIMLAEKASDIIRGRAPLPRVEV